MNNYQHAFTTYCHRNMLKCWISSHLIHKRNHLIVFLISLFSNASRNFWRGGGIVIERWHFLSSENKSARTPLQVFQSFGGEEDRSPYPPRWVRHCHCSTYFNCCIKRIHINMTKYSR